MTRRRVGISLLAYSPHRLAGQGTYTVGVTRALISRGVHDYVVLVPRQYDSLWTEALPPATTLVTCGPDPDDRVKRVIFEQRRIPEISTQYGIHTVFFPHLVAPRWQFPRAVVTVHDLLLLSETTDFPWYKRLYLRWSYKQLRSRVGHIAAVSEFCRRDIIAKLGVAPERVSVVYPGLDPEFADTSLQEVLGQNCVEAPYILSVAGAYPHKRLDVLLEAFAAVAVERPDLHLVLAGAHAGRPEAVSRLRAQAARSGLGGRIRFLPRLPRAQIPLLFAGAMALVSASEFEGFGIPLLEAMAMECPVAATPADAVVEVLGGCGWLAEDFSAASLAVAVKQAARARVADRQRLAAARDRALTTFTWDRSAAVLEGVFACVSSRDTAVDITEKSSP
jgi:glycosyltransferase involved in cell wall biosynthesis